MRRMRQVFRVLMITVLLALAAAPAFADTGGAAAITIDRGKLLVPPKNADGTISVTPFTDNPVLWARDEQQRFYAAMSGRIKDIRGASPWAAALSLMLLSFGYGVFHAAGPGHGKAVISGWLLATESQLRRGIAIAFLSSMFQALTAVVLVTVPLLLFAGAATAARSAAGVLESVSFALIAALGFYLLASGLHPFFQSRPRPALAPAAAVNRRHEPAGQRLEIVSELMNASHVHGPDCGCGHAHVPRASDVNGVWSSRRAFSLAFAIGLRPCTGALLVLIFANAFGLYWAGVASTLAMGLGTFITVSLIAALAVYSKRLALRFAAQDARWLIATGTALRVLGGFGIFAFGALMFAASLNGPTGSM